MAIPRPDFAASTPDRRYRLAEIILAESERAGLHAGSRLPTERQLAADLGATRTSVRRALAVLEAEGRISRQVGRGTFLRDAPRRGPAEAAGPAQWAAGHDGGHAARDRGQGAGPGEVPGTMGFAPADVMAIRRLLEPPAMR